MSVEKPVNELRDEFVWFLQGGLDEDAVPGATLYNLVKYSGIKYSINWLKLC